MKSGGHVLTIGYGLLILAGCNSSSTPGQPGAPAVEGQSVVEQAQAADDWQRDYARLKALGAAFHSRIDSGTVPAGWTDVKQSAPALSELETEGWIVAWGKHPRDITQGSSEFVLAYSPKGLNAESAVLFMDGSVMRLTPEELKAKLAAQEAPPSP
jgi:hypothetical protein